MRLQPGVIALPGASSWSPLQISLAIAWVLAGVGVVALALLLAGTLRLSERPIASHACSHAQALWFGPRNAIDD